MNTTTANHWTELLPEVGTFARNGQRQLTRLEQIEYLSNELNRLQMEYDQEESRLIDEAKSDWTMDEINEAMANAKEPII